MEDADIFLHVSKRASKAVQEWKLECQRDYDGTPRELSVAVGRAILMVGCLLIADGLELPVSDAEVNAQECIERFCKSVG